MDYCIQYGGPANECEHCMKQYFQRETKSDIFVTEEMIEQAAKAYCKDMREERERIESILLKHGFTPRL